MPSHLLRHVVLLVTLSALVLTGVAQTAGAQEEPPQPVADLSVSKTASETTAADADISYSITVTNNGPDAAAGVTLSDPLPAGTTFVSLTQNSGPAFTCETPGPSDPDTVNCDVASLAAGAEATFTLVAHTAAETAPGTMFTNVATAATETFDSNDENDSGSATSIVPGDQADMRIGLQAPETSPPGRDVTYEIEVGNGGPQAAAAEWQDTLPGTATFVSLTQASGSPFSCTTPAIGAGGTVTCIAPELAAGATATFTLVVNIPPETESGTEFVNQAAITTPAQDPNDENDLATTTTTINDADLSATLSAPATALAGDTITYSLSLANAGPDAATSVSLVDVLPSEVTFVSLTQTTGPAFALSTPAVGSGGTVSASAPALASGASATFELVVRIASVTPTGTIENTVGADAYEADSDPTDDSASVTTSVTGVPPAEPSELTVSPTPPADDNTPRVSGSAEPGSTVRVYATADCSGTPVATGTAAEFTSPGLPVSVAGDSTTTFRATATDADGTSPCSTSFATYVEDSPPAAPVGLSSTPGSGDDNAPRISGTAQAGSTVRLYRSADCSGVPTATGSAAEFASPGLRVSVGDNTTTTFRATATDGGGTSACSTSSVTYEERSPDATSPAMSGLGLSRSVFRAAKRGPAVSARRGVGTRVSFTLSEAATVRFTVQRQRTGRRSAAGRCVRTTPGIRGRRRCKLWPKLPGSIRVAGTAGMNSFVFRGRVAGRALKPGRYRLNGRATDLAGNDARLKRKRFRIVR